MGAYLLDIKIKISQKSNPTIFNLYTNALKKQIEIQRTFEIPSTKPNYL